MSNEDQDYVKSLIEGVQNGEDKGEPDRALEASKNIVALIDTLLNSSPETETPEKAAGVSDETLEIEDGSFHPVPLESFYSCLKSVFGIHVRINPGKYVKILHAGDAFTYERLQSYKRQGVKYFYIQKSEKENQLKLCDNLVKKVLNDPKAPYKTKVNAILALGDQISKFLEPESINEKNAEYAKSFVADTCKLANNIRFRKNETIRSYLDDINSHEHGVSVTFLVALMLPEMHFKTAKAVEIAGLAALLHDFALPRELHHEDVMKMTLEQQDVYYDHPANAGKVLRNVGFMEPAVSQIIEQHHVRYKGKGFPDDIPASSLNKIAETIGLCDEYCRIIAQKKVRPELDIQKTLEKVYDGFSASAVEIFKKVFFPKVRTAGGVVHAPQQKKSAA